MTTVVLWLSFQRYALLLWLVSAAAIGVPLAFGWPWWAVGLGIAAAIKPALAAIHIARQYPTKLRLRRVLERRIERGGFQTAVLSQYAGDPCHRVVLLDVLRTAGHGFWHRRRLLRELATRHREEANAVVLPGRILGPAARHHTEPSTERTDTETPTS